MRAHAPLHNQGASPRAELKQQVLIAELVATVRPSPRSCPVPPLSTLAAAANERLDEQVAVRKPRRIDFVSIDRQLASDAANPGSRAAFGKGLLVPDRRRVFRLEQGIDSALRLAPLEEGRRPPRAIVVERENIIPGS